MKQKTTFLAGEADSLFERNKEAQKNKDFSKDLIVSEIVGIITDNKIGLDLNIRGQGCLLEIGCGEGRRLEYLQNNYNLKCFGIDPSKKAVEKGISKGISAKIGTADQLDFEDKYFDFVIFGFCLYLCDRDDLFQIAKETDRVIKNEGFIIVLDFYNPGKNRKNKYIHKDGIYSYKMDYRNLFTWHPFYECYKHTVMHHKIDNRPDSKLLFTDEIDEWISISVLRKNKYFNEKSFHH